MINKVNHQYKEDIFNWKIECEGLEQTGEACQKKLHKIERLRKLRLDEIEEKRFGSDR